MSDSALLTRYKLARREYVIILVALLGVSAIVPSLLPSAITQQNDAQGLTGPHAALQCNNCHGEGVWHTTQINATICKLCHGTIWNTVSGSKHNNLFVDGQLQKDSGTIRVKYCLTCHNPHQPDSLRLRYTNGTSLRISFDNYKNLCLKCHTFS